MPRRLSNRELTERGAICLDTCGKWQLWQLPNNGSEWWSFLFRMERKQKGVKSSFRLSWNGDRFADTSDF
ncbi:MAG: hypothetical protein DHS20C01_34520 [marine bacterium B5-7]|nr:MAG: hypothetical protein DHS20C01_34520 [marine bacterium B5-7]